MKHSFDPIDMFSQPREKGQAEWQTFNALRREAGAYTISTFRSRSPSTPRVIQEPSRLFILKKA